MTTDQTKPILKLTEQPDHGDFAGRGLTVPDFELSAHARDMLTERNIPEGWVWRAVRFPTSTHRGVDGNMHYIKVIDEAGGRFLRVVVNAVTEPQRVVTVFFDRRLMRKT